MEERGTVWRNGERCGGKGNSMGERRIGKLRKEVWGKTEERSEVGLGRAKNK